MRLLAICARILLSCFSAFRNDSSVLYFKSPKKLIFPTKMEIFSFILFVRTIRASANFLIAPTDTISPSADSFIVAMRERLRQSQKKMARWILRHSRKRESKKFVDIFSPRIFAKEANGHEKGISPLLTYIRIGRGEREIRLRTSGDLHRR